MWARTGELCWPRCSAWRRAVVTSRLNRCPTYASYCATMFPGVDIHEAALSNHPGTADFAYVHGVSEGWSGLLFRPLPTGADAEVEQISVRLEVLDEMLDPEYVPAVIKIDVEGAEQQVFEGALGTLRRHRPIVIFEHGAGRQRPMARPPTTSTLCSVARPDYGSSTSTAPGRTRSKSCNASSTHVNG